ncbi:MAG: hypothetical protein ACI8ZX_001146 [Planctomycetota bacterium]|jgi:hypothetical protein
MNTTYNTKSIRIGIVSFIIVLLFMPLGHSLMILNEKIFIEYKYWGAFTIGLLGVVLLAFSLSQTVKNSISTLLGLLAGIFVWTGWIEFSFVWIAEKLNIPALIENGEVVTKPEYLIMPSSIGLLGVFFLVFLFSFNKCQFFNWFQSVLKILPNVKMKGSVKPIAITTFLETVMILWTFYIVLLLVYDESIAGDKHLLTYIVAFGSLAWSIYLFNNLIRIKNFDSAIRYAVPTVIIFWNFVEILGRWGLFKEIWVHPFEYKIEIGITTLTLLLFISYYYFNTRKMTVLKLSNNN